MCSMFVRSVDVRRYALTDIPNLDLLRIDADDIAEDKLRYPRHALTTWGQYCLQPVAVHSSSTNSNDDDDVTDDDDDVHVDVCTSCYKSLSNYRIPDESLVAFDTGSIPDELQPLSAVEENLLSLHRVHRQLYMMKPWMTSEMCHRAHVIAIPNAGPAAVRDCILEHPDELTETMQVVFMTLVDTTNLDEVQRVLAERLAKQKMAKNSPALRIRVKEVLKWAEHLSKVYNMKPYADDHVRQAYEDLNDQLPLSIIDAAIVPRTDAEYKLLLKTFTGQDRQGPGNNKHTDEEAMNTEGAKGPVYPQDDIPGK